MIKYVGARTHVMSFTVILHTSAAWCSVVWSACGCSLMTRLSCAPLYDGSMFIGRGR
jgi:hypothetical protein